MEQISTVSDLIRHLQTFPSSTPVSLRDLNGLDWNILQKNIRLEQGEVVIDTQGINKV